MKSKKIALFIALMVGSTGCVVLNTMFPNDDYTFGHKMHIEAEDLECIDCHVYAEDEEEPGIPRAKQCNLCHEDLDAELPEEKWVGKAFYKNGEYQRSHAWSFDAEITFSHMEHVSEYEDDCTICHVGLDTNNQPKRIDPLRMASCLDCHQDEGMQDECTTCHQVVNDTWEPRSHDLGWDRLHGDVSRECSEQTADNCSLCHTEQSCDTCHQTMQPDNHGGYFARRGHGIHAQMDRDNCAACHTPNYCDRCHEVSEPINHTGSFGGSQSNHCVGCHMPLQGEGCYACHKDTPSHLLATPLPMDHNPGMNCRQCHGVDQPLPHPDKGDSCVSCHM